MNIYIGLIIFIFAISGLSGLLFKENEKRQRFLLIASAFAMFLICALKKETVGVDTQGYKHIYEITPDYAWNDFDFYYFEWGYMLLMKIFSMGFGASFEVFCVFIYGFIFFALIKFIDCFSNYTLLSLIMYICYVFFTFNLTALRYSISLAVCQLAFVAVSKHKFKYDFFVFLPIVWIASLFHRSAWAILPVYIISKIEFSMSLTVLFDTMLAAAFLFRKQLISFVNAYISDVEIGTLEIGGNIIFLIGMAVFITISLYYNFPKNQDEKESTAEDEEKNITLSKESSVKGPFISLRNPFRRTYQIKSMNTLFSRERREAMERNALFLREKRASVDINNPFARDVRKMENKKELFFREKRAPVKTDNPVLREKRMPVNIRNPFLREKRAPVSIDIPILRNKKGSTEYYQSTIGGYGRAENKNSKKTKKLTKKSYQDYIKYLLMAVTVMMIAGNGTSDFSRIALYYSMFAVVAVPNTIRLYDKNTQAAASVAIMAFLFVFYYLTILRVNTYYVLPYLFFWES